MNGATATSLILTPAHWGTWVAQRHEWCGYLWLRWADAEAILLFVYGRPRIHLWDGAGWVEGEQAIAAVAQRLERFPPRWGQVSIPARWASAIRELTLVHPALPADVVPPEAWLAWARRQGFVGLAVLVGETAGAWVLRDGSVHAVRFSHGVAVPDGGEAPPKDGLLQIYRGRVVVELSPPAPAEQGETAVEVARSEVPRRFRGDERFLLAPTVDVANPAALEEILTTQGESVLRWLPLLDGSRMLEEVARDGSVSIGVVDTVVGMLVDRRLVFRYRARGRTATPST